MGTEDSECKAAMANTSFSLYPQVKFRLTRLILVNADSILLAISSSIGVGVAGRPVRSTRLAPWLASIAYSRRE
jgi:hypothetical protein